MDKKDYELVNMIASNLYKRYCPQGDTGGQTPEDFYHFGIIGFLKAKKDYNKKKGSFAPYAKRRINGEILDAVRLLPMVRVPKEKYTLVKELKQAQKTLQDKGLDPDPKALTAHLDWSYEKLLEAESLARFVVSLDQKAATGHPIQLLSNTSTETDLLDKDFATIIDHCLKQIREIKSRLIFTARYHKGMTLEQVSDKYGSSIETIRRKQIQATQSMKSCLKKNGWTLN